MSFSQSAAGIVKIGRIVAVIILLRQRQSSLSLRKIFSGSAATDWSTVSPWRANNSLSVGCSWDNSIHNVRWNMVKETRLYSVFHTEGTGRCDYKRVRGMQRLGSMGKGTVWREERGGL